MEPREQTCPGNLALKELDQVLQALISESNHRGLFGRRYYIKVGDQVECANEELKVPLPKREYKVLGPYYSHRLRAIGKKEENIFELVFQFVSGIV